MAKNDQQEAYEKLLTSSLARVIDFVKYAEAKNAALLTFCSAWTLASINIFNNIAKPIPSIWVWCGTISIFMFTVSAMIAIRTLLPKKLEHLFKDPDGDRSLIYFGHIALYETSKYTTLIQDQYKPTGEDSATSKYLNDLAVQISINSKIAARKFSLFNWGALLAIAGILILIIPATNPTVQIVWHWATAAK